MFWHAMIIKLANWKLAKLGNLKSARGAVGWSEDFGPVNPSSNLAED